MAEMQFSGPFGTWLREQREGRRMSREHLAEAVGYSAEMIKKIELGHRNPSSALADKLANVFHIPKEQHDDFRRFARPKVKGASDSKQPADFVEPIDPEEVATSEEPDQVVPEVSHAQPHAPVYSHARWRNLVLLLGCIVLLIVVGLMRFNGISRVPVQAQLFSLSTSQGQHRLLCTFQQGRSLDSAFAISSNTSTLTLQAGGWTDLVRDDTSAPLVICPITGDFELQTTVSFKTTKCCQHAGIGVRSPRDPFTWLRITIDHARIVAINGAREKIELTGASTPIDTEVVAFKITRKGDSFQLAYRSDEDAWIPLNKPYGFALPQEAEIFLVVLSAHNAEPISAQFSNIEVR